MEPVTADEENGTAANLRRQALGMLPIQIPGMNKAMDALNPVFSSIGNIWDTIINTINNAVLSVINKPQAAAKTELLAAVNNSSDFTRVATQLGLSEALGNDLKHMTEQSAKNAFGFMGMSADKATAVDNLIKLQQSLETRIRTGLVDTYGSQLDDNARADIARKAAASITGLNRDHLESSDCNRLIAAEPPTSGYGAMLFGIRNGIEAQDTTLAVTPFAIAETNLSAARSGLPGQQAPAAPATPTPEMDPQMLAQAQIWFNTAVSRGVKFNDTNNDGVVDIKDIGAQLAGKTKADIISIEKFLDVTAPAITPGSSNPGRGQGA